MFRPLVTTRRGPDASTALAGAAARPARTGPDRRDAAGVRRVDLTP